ncbi:MAG: NAD(P)/FAD-dependent oxidoreductase [Spirochaetales bacterium]|nr:NAD(P)/FAD-dependent oxidoreductase [Spirochaetales bacterium]
MTGIRKRVAVIGSGMAGLTAGAYLAREGHRVVVYEQYPEPGGVTATIRQDGFSWDLGPLILEGFGPDEPGSRILKEIGVPEQRVRDMVTEPCDRGIIFPDFALWRPVEYEGALWRKDRLKSLFPDDSRGLDRYYRFYLQMERLASLNRRSQMRGERAGLADRLRMAMSYLPVKRFASLSAAELMEGFFSSEKLRAVFTGILADLMVTPDEFPALGVPLLNPESAFDARIVEQGGLPKPPSVYRCIRNGCGSLVSAAHDALAAAGGVVRTSAAVTRISTDSGTATGVVVDGKSEPADLVVSTAGARETFFDLLGADRLTKEYRSVIDGQVQMESVFMVHLGVEREPAQPSALGYYYGTHEVGRAVSEIRSSRYHDGADGFLIYIPSRHSPAMAPPGCHAVTIYTVAPNAIEGGDWEQLKEQYADHLVACAEKYAPGLAAATRTRVILTPADFRRRVRQHHHSFGGIAPVRGRPNPGFRTPVRNLWFIGSQSESGGGVLGVMQGARAAVRVMREA